MRLCIRLVKIWPESASLLTYRVVVPKKEPRERQPREWFADHDHLRAFGKTYRVDWAEASSPQEQAELLAAKLQHRLGVLVTSNRRGVGLSRQELADLVGLSTGQVDRLLNGSTRMTLEQMYRLAAAINRKVRVEIVAAKQQNPDED